MKTFLITKILLQYDYSYSITATVRDENFVNFNIDVAYQSCSLSILLLVRGDRWRGDNMFFSSILFHIFTS